MSYVMIDSGSLSGVGKLEGVVRHGDVVALGVSEGPSNGADAQARAQIIALFTATIVEWFGEISKAILDAPTTFLPSVVNDSVANLKVAREKLNSQVKPHGLAFIRDTSIPLVEVETRIIGFLRDYHDVIVGQLRLAKQDAKSATMLARLGQFRDALRGVVRAAVVGVRENVVEPAVSGLPFWVLPAAGLLAVAYVLRSAR